MGVKGLIGQLVGGQLVYMGLKGLNGMNGMILLVIWSVVR